ncbi:putative germin-like protein 2-1 [Juglans microcarpa x Juglans regia]|uniref:putative germin-like protein 2-1 n=1 Tax=Juglans microcarpa x Juglans regia TaxID=2249226 RepID=UPI001B7EF00F|nr:putative germin-like protein 2-1 [Juglans microcarpa x Juglans regia]
MEACVFRRAKEFSTSFAVDLPHSAAVWLLVMHGCCAWLLKLLEWWTFPKQQFVAKTAWSWFSNLKVGLAGPGCYNTCLQDFCVAHTNSQVVVNGFACKDPETVQANDFPSSGLHIAGNTSNLVGSKVTVVTAGQIPGLDTLSISLARIDYAPWGINPPHTHPCASDISTVLKGSLEVGFLTSSNPENLHITKVIQKGDVFVFPVDLIHYQRNVGNGNAIAIAAFSSRNPCVITVANFVFGSNPDIASDILVKAFQVDKNVITHI